MIKPIMRDPLFLAALSSEATQEDLPVTRSIIAKAY